MFANEHFAEWTVCSMDTLTNGHFAKDILPNMPKIVKFLFNGYLTLKRGLSYCFDCQKTYIGPDIYAW